MSIQILSKSIFRGVTLFSRLTANEVNRSLIDRNFNSITKNLLSRITLPVNLDTISVDKHFNNRLLQPAKTVMLNQKCGLKYKKNLRKRCKDCYFYIDDGRWYVRCRTHPRHKQAQIVKSESNTWILTSVQQSKKRPWWSNIHRR